MYRRYPHEIDYCDDCYEGDHEVYDVPSRTAIDDYNVTKDGYFRYNPNDTAQMRVNDKTIRYSPVIPTSVPLPSLQNMTSVTVTLSLWNHLNVPFVMARRDKTPETLHTDLSCLLYGKTLELLDELSLPKAIAEKIVEFAKLIKTELHKWISYHSPKVFFNYKTSNILYNPNIINHFVWNPDGKLNYERTAISLTTCDRLSKIEKYHLLCLYCLKDEMQILSASLFKNNVVDYVTFARYPLIFYWDCYFRNELEKIPVPRGESIYSFMFNFPNVDNWPAKEYFFKLLSSDDQIKHAVSFVDRCTPKYQKLLLSMLDESQRLQVIASRAVKIIENYLSQSPDYTSDIVSIWPEMGNLINRDEFVKIYYRLLIRGTDAIILKNIWTSVSDDFKRAVLNYNEYKIISEALRVLVDDKNDLFFTLVSDATAGMKKSIVKKSFFPQHCVKLLSLGQLPMLEKLINVCLPGTKDAAEFKMNLVEEDYFISYGEQMIREGDLDSFDHLLRLFVPSADKAARFKQDINKYRFFTTHCEELIVAGNFNRLDALLNSFLPQLEHRLEFKRDLVMNSDTINQHCLTFYASGNAENLNNLLANLFPTLPNIVCEYKKSLILSEKGKNACLDLVDSDVNLSGIISDSLPPEIASQFVTDLIFTPPVVAKFNGYILSNNLDRVDKCIDRYCASVEHKTELKKQIIGDPVDLIRAMIRNFDGSVLNSVLLWWLVDGKRIHVFKSALPLDKVFDEILKDCIFSFYDPEHRLTESKFRPVYYGIIRFNTLDKFLMWYFDSPSKIREFKLRRVDSYQEIDTIRTLLKKKDDKYLKAIMHWFFEANTVDIEKFKMKNRGRKILNFL